MRRLVALSKGGLRTVGRSWGDSSAGARTLMPLPPAPGRRGVQGPACTHAYASVLKNAPLLTPSSHSPPADEECMDLHPMCRVWASEGECEANPNYMVRGGASVRQGPTS